MNRHPSYEGLRYIVADRLAQDGVEATQAEATAKAVSEAIWVLSETAKRKDLPKTAFFIRDSSGVVAQLIWPRDSLDVAS